MSRNYSLGNKQKGRWILGKKIFSTALSLMLQTESNTNFQWKRIDPINFAISICWNIVWLLDQVAQWAGECVWLTTDIRNHNYEVYLEVWKKQHEVITGQNRTQ